MRQRLLKSLNTPPAAGTCRLNIVLWNANGIEIGDGGSAVDAYCTLQLADSHGSVYGKKDRTLTCDNEWNPEWNEKFSFNVVSGQDQLCIRLFDEDTFSQDDQIGEIFIPIQSLVEQTVDGAITTKLQIPLVPELQPKVSQGVVTLVKYLHGSSPTHGGERVMEPVRKRFKNITRTLSPLKRRKSRRVVSSTPIQGLGQGRMQWQGPEESHHGKISSMKSRSWSPGELTTLDTLEEEQDNVEEEHDDEEAGVKLPEKLPKRTSKAGYARPPVNSCVMRCCALCLQTRCTFQFPSCAVNDHLL